MVQKVARAHSRSGSLKSSQMTMPAQPAKGKSIWRRLTCCLLFTNLGKVVYLRSLLKLLGLVHYQAGYDRAYEARGQKQGSGTKKLARNIVLREQD